MFVVSLSLSLCVSVCVYVYVYVSVCVCVCVCVTFANSSDYSNGFAESLSFVTARVSSWPSSKFQTNSHHFHWVLGIYGCPGEHVIIMAELFFSAP